MALTLQQRLDAAKAAYHAVLTGTQAKVVVDQNGERVEFNAVNISKLALYIADLEAELAGTNVNRGPMKVWYK